MKPAPLVDILRPFVQYLPDVEWMLERQTEEGPKELILRSRDMLAYAEGESRLKDFKFVISSMPAMESLALVIVAPRIGAQVMAISQPLSPEALAMVGEVLG